jgi:hypothetical protein
LLTLKTIITTFQQVKTITALAHAILLDGAAGGRLPVASLIQFLDAKGGAIVILVWCAYIFIMDQ